MFVYIMERLKYLLRNKQYDEKVLLLYVEEAYYMACGYCNRDEMPEESYTSIALLSQALLNQSDPQSNIKSLTEGGRTATFGQLGASDLINNALKNLNKWKRARTI